MLVLVETTNMELIPHIHRDVRDKYGDPDEYGFKGSLIKQQTQLMTQRLM